MSQAVLAIRKVGCELFRQAVPHNVSIYVVKNILVTYPQPFWLLVCLFAPRVALRHKRCMHDDPERTADDACVGADGRTVSRKLRAKADSGGARRAREHDLETKASERPGTMARCRSRRNGNADGRVSFGRR